MAAPIIKVKRSAVAGKIPTIAGLDLGEFAINTYDGKVYIEQDQGGVGVGTTIVVVNPWSVGLGSTSFNTYFTNGSVGIGTTNPTSALTVQGDALVSGVATFQNSVYLGDNDFIYFGNSSDLYIGHNGSVSAIADTGTGDLYIAGDNSLIITDLSYAENKAKFNTNGSVELYYDNVKEFETTGYGATIFGILQTQGLQVNSGISTFTNGPVFIGSGTSTGTASQPLQVTGGAYVSGNLGVGSTSPTSALTVQGDALVSGVVTATAFVGSGANLTNLPSSSNLVGVSTLGFFGDDQNITSSLTLPSNTKLYTVHKNINVATGSTFTVGSSSTIIMDRFNNLDDVVATSFKGDGSQLTGIPVGDLYELDSISPAGRENTYTPTFNYDTVSVTDPFRLLISVNGIMQSAYVHNTEYVHNNYLLASRTGYTIDYDGKIKFTESLPEGSEVVIKTTAGTTKSTTRRYPFTALDILF